jgi:hypothetical protein
LNPGENTTVSVSMIMHPGMDGPHLFRLAVPVYELPSQSAEVLELHVRALFR